MNLMLTIGAGVIAIICNTLFVHYLVSALNKYVLRESAQIPEYTEGVIAGVLGIQIWFLIVGSSTTLLK